MLEFVINVKEMYKMYLRQKNIQVHKGLRVLAPLFGSLERSQQLLAYCSQIPGSTNTTPRTFVSQKRYTRC